MSLPAIPKIVHLTAKNKNNLPKLFRRNISIMRKFYPDHNFRIHDDADIDAFVSTTDPVFYRTTFSKLPSQIMRVDAVRYLWMEAIGGIYFDLDIRMQKQWDPLHGAVLVGREWTWPKDDAIQMSVHNCVFASIPGHPLWRHLLDGISRQVSQHGPASEAWPSVFDVTGPNAISRTITQERLTQTLDEIHILNASCIYQKGLSTGSLKDALFIHQTSGSWNNSPMSVLGLIRRYARTLYKRVRDFR